MHRCAIRNQNVADYNCIVVPFGSNWGFICTYERKYIYGAFI